MTESGPTPSEDLLKQHEYRFGFDTNCSCGAAGIWYWADWVTHMAPLLEQVTADA